MRTGFFAFITSKKQKAVNDSVPSFGKTVLEAVKNSKGTTEEELAGEMKGVLDSMSVLKDCEAKTKLVDVVKDCFDNKEMTLKDEDEVIATLDSMWIDIHGDSLKEIAKAFAKLSEKPEPEVPAKDSEPKEDEDKDSEPEEEESKDSESKEDEDKDSEPKEDKDKDSSDKKEKDGCNKDSALVASIMDSLKKELKPMVTEAVKECLGLKDGKPSVEGSELDSANKDEMTRFDYESFI